MPALTAGVIGFVFGVKRDANMEITSIELAYENSGSNKARGIDFGLQYQMQTRFGTFTSLTQATFLGSFQFAQLGSAKNVAEPAAEQTASYGLPCWKNLLNNSTITLVQQCLRSRPTRCACQCELRRLPLRLYRPLRLRQREEEILILRFYLSAPFRAC